MRTYRTVLEQKISERRLTLDEFAEFAETFAREHGEPGTLSARHVQRLASGHGPSGKPLGAPRPATARLLERIFGLGVDELLAPPARLDAASVTGPTGAVATGERRARGGARREQADRPREAGPTEQDRQNLDAACVWLDNRAGWLPATTQRKVSAQVARLDAGRLIDQRTVRARTGRRRLAHALSEYYQDAVPGYRTFRATCGEQQISTSILTRPDWLDLACPLTPDNDLMTLARPSCDERTEHLGKAAGQAIHRLVEAAALDVRMTNMPLYRLLEVEPTTRAIAGSVAAVPFLEYALTMDLLETELVDAVAAGGSSRFGALPLRDRYLPDLRAVVDISGRLCVGGALALCAIARPSDPYRGGPDYALLVQQRSAHVLNAVGQLSVIPKGFHQPLKEVRADVGIGTTLRRGLEEELFGRRDIDSAMGERRVADPMHPSRLSEPMQWLTAEPDRLQMECTGFGLNLMSGNYEFASLIVINDDEFWRQYGGVIEANWESSGLRVYSSLDTESLAELAGEDSWSNEGLFAFLHGLRRLAELGGQRADLPLVAI